MYRTSGKLDIEPQKKPPLGAPAAMNDLLRLMQNVALVVPERTTIRQFVFFLAALRSATAGQMVTRAELIRELDEVMGRSIEKSAALWFQPTPSYPEGVGWLDHQLNRRDHREKLIKTTAKGNGVVALLTQLVEDLRVHTEDPQAPSTAPGANPASSSAR